MYQQVLFRPMNLVTLIKHYFVKKNFTTATTSSVQAGTYNAQILDKIFDSSDRCDNKDLDLSDQDDCLKGIFEKLSNKAFYNKHPLTGRIILISIISMALVMLENTPFQGKLGFTCDIPDNQPKDWFQILFNADTCMWHVTVNATSTQAANIIATLWLKINRRQVETSGWTGDKSFYSSC